ncbi:hypothetical protein ABW19_dt0204400 [Dactylella cylindrospora]|nr:hypothetical protein ABW19_dt0204400 [Dactylella cylindrospora]
MATNYSFPSLIAAYILCAVPQAYAIYTVVNYGKGVRWSVPNPRSMPHVLKSQLDNETYERVCRGIAAQFNGFENLPLFAVAVLAANAARLPLEIINHHVISYVISRIFYIIAYIGINHRWLSFIRSAVYFTGIYFIGSLVYMSLQVIGDRWD